MRNAIKSAAGTIVSALPQARYERGLFIVAHMRCGSTALSNVLCSHPMISGYGETHVAYHDDASMGRLIVNQARRRAWKPGARYLFDKVLHSRHDASAPPAFADAHAVFLARRPAPSVASIHNLFRTQGKNEYTTHEEAARYYLERLEAIMRLRERHPSDLRLTLTHDELIQDPESVIARLSRWLRLDPPLENRYVSHAASTRGGGGDPLASGSRDRIERRKAPASEPELEIDDALRGRLDAAYAEFAASTDITAGQAPSSMDA